MGLAVPALTVLVVEAAPTRLRGRATSLSATATFLAQPVAPLLLGPFVTATSITTGFAATAALASMTLLIILTTRARPTTERASA